MKRVVIRPPAPYFLTWGRQKHRVYFRDDDPRASASEVPSSSAAPPVAVNLPSPTASPMAVDLPLPTVSPMPAQLPLPTASPMAVDLPLPTASPMAVDLPLPTVSPMPAQVPLPIASSAAADLPLPVPSPVAGDLPLPISSPMAVDLPLPRTLRIKINGNRNGTTPSKIINETKVSCPSPVVGDLPLPRTLRIGTNGNRIGTTPSKIINESKVSSRSSKRISAKTQKKEKTTTLSLVVPLSKSEIEEDFLKMIGRKPARRPKKRRRAVQQDLDEVFPGLDLVKISSAKYDDVPGPPDNFRSPPRKINGLKGLTEEYYDWED